MRETDIKEKLIKSIGIKRFNHSIRVVETAMTLSRQHRVSKEKTYKAALLHDCGRLKENDLVLEKLQSYGIILNNQTYHNPNLQHSILGRFIASAEYGIEDTDILLAIRFHTTGRKKMTDIEKIIYLADAIEPERDYEGLTQIRELAMVDLNGALLLSLEQTLDFLKRKEIGIDKNTIEAIEWLKNNN